MAKNGHFLWNFKPILDIFYCGHIYVSNGRSWGTTSRPHLGDLVMNLFFTLGSTTPQFMPGDSPKMVHFGPIMVNYGRLFDIPNCFWQIWTVLCPSDTFGPFKTKIISLPQIDKVGFGRGGLEQKIIVLFEMVEKSPDGSKRVSNGRKQSVDHFGPYWTSLERWQACHV